MKISKRIDAFAAKIKSEYTATLLNKNKRNSFFSKVEPYAENDIRIIANFHIYADTAPTTIKKPTENELLTARVVYSIHRYCDEISRASLVGGPQKQSKEQLLTTLLEYLIETMPKLEKGEDFSALRERIEITKKELVPFLIEVKRLVPIELVETRHSRELDDLIRKNEREKEFAAEQARLVQQQKESSIQNANQALLKKELATYNTIEQWREMDVTSMPTDLVSELKDIQISHISIEEKLAALYWTLERYQNFNTVKKMLSVCKVIDNSKNAIKQAPNVSNILHEYSIFLELHQWLSNTVEGSNQQTSFNPYITDKLKERKQALNENTMRTDHLDFAIRLRKQLSRLWHEFEQNELSLFAWRASISPEKRAQKFKEYFLRILLAYTDTLSQLVWNDDHEDNKAVKKYSAGSSNLLKIMLASVSHIMPLMGTFCLTKDDPCLKFYARKCMDLGNFLQGNTVTEVMIPTAEEFKLYKIVEAKGKLYGAVHNFGLSEEEVKAKLARATEEKADFPPPPPPPPEFELSDNKGESRRTVGISSPRPSMFRRSGSGLTLQDQDAQNKMLRISSTSSSVTASATLAATPPLPPPPPPPSVSPLQSPR